MRLFNSLMVMGALGLSASSNQALKQTAVMSGTTNIKMDNFEYDGYFSEGEFRSGKRIRFDTKGQVDIVEKGSFQNNEFLKGVKTYTDGGIDEGSFLDGGLHGKKCIRIYPDGRKEEGVFKFNEFISGIRTYPDGGLDMGHFKDGQLQGWNNSRIYSNGTVVSGRFENHDFKEGLWMESVDSNIARKIVPCQSEPISVVAPTNDSNTNNLLLYLLCGVITFIHFRFSYS